MKAISIKQPWASLIVEGIKPIENRAMLWKHRGPLAIHASKTFDVYWPEWLCNLNHVQETINESRGLTGGIIGSVNMVDCVSTHSSEFFFGPFGYVLENPQKCELIPWKGKQGVMNIDLSLCYVKRLSWHFPGYNDCTGCGNLFHGYPTDKRCPTCNDFVLPF